MAEDQLARGDWNRASAGSILPCNLHGMCMSPIVVTTVRYQALALSVPARCVIAYCIRCPRAADITKPWNASLKVYMPRHDGFMLSRRRQIISVIIH